MVSFYYHQRSCGFETHAAFYAYYGVAYVHVASYGVARGYGFEFRYDFERGFLHPVQSDRFAFFKIYGYGAKCGLLQLAGISLFRQCGVGIQSFYTAYRRAPYAFVYRILRLFP